MTKAWKIPPILRLLLVMSVLVVYVSTNITAASFESPIGGGWITLDSLNTPAIDDQYYSVSSCDSLHYCALACDFHSTHYAYVKQSSDGGRTWSTIRTDNNVGEIYQRRMVAEIDTSSCVVMCDGGLVLKTYDNGKNWQTDTLPIHNGNHQARILQVKGRTVAALYDTDTSMWISKNAGKSWTQIPCPGSAKIAYIATIALLNDHTILATAHFATDVDPYHYAIMRSTDYGQTWKRITSVPSTQYYVYLSFSDSLHGFGQALRRMGLKYKNQIWATDNGGESWSMRYEDSIWDFNYYYRICALDSLNATMLRGDAILLTKDGGYTWNLRTIQFNNDVTSNSYLESVCYSGGYPVICNRKIMRGLDVASGILYDHRDNATINKAVKYLIAGSRLSFKLSSDIDEILEITVYDIAGHIIIRTHVQPDDTHIIEMDDLNIRAGMYLLFQPPI